MKKIITITLIVLGIWAISLLVRPVDKKPVYVEYFKMGDTLPPSYVCQDTMIVIDAVGFNRAMGYIEQGFIDGTDSDLDSLTHLYCRKINH